MSAPGFCFAALLTLSWFHGQEEREKTTGDGWFNMKAPELTEELKNDLRALKMRSAMDPKRFYKKNDREGFPKYLQVCECPSFNSQFISQLKNTTGAGV